MSKPIVAGTNGVIDDNSAEYVNLLLAAIGHADPDAAIIISKTDNLLSVVIEPSVKEFRDHIIKNVLDVHSLLKLKTEFTKSTKITKKLYFQVSFG